MHALIEAMSSCKDVVSTDEGTTTEVHVIDVEGHLPGVGVGHSFLSSHDAVVTVGLNWAASVNWKEMYRN